MKQAYGFILTMLLPIIAVCQSRITVTDKYTREPISYVVVTNKRTKESTRTDATGKCILTINNGDSVFFSHPAYTFTLKRMNSNANFVELYPESHKLKEVEVLSPQKKFERDSAERQLIYRKSIQDARRKPKAMFSNGIVVEGAISKLAMKVSGKDKKNKKFLKTLEADDKQRFIDTRYTNELVESLTPLRGDTVLYFKQQYPMPYEFARSATPLEIKAWIREKHKLWQLHPVIPTDTFIEMQTK